MFCATSCVLSICLNLPKQVGESDTSPLLMNSKNWIIWKFLSSRMLFCSCKGKGYFNSNSWSSSNNKLLSNYQDLSTEQLPNSCEEKKAQNLVTEFSSYYQVKGFWFNSRIIDFPTFHKLLSFSAGFRG